MTQNAASRMIRRSAAVAAGIVAVAAPLAVVAPTASAIPGEWPKVNPVAYKVGGSYYFTSPSRGWKCAIRLDRGAPWAGCQGKIPARAPRVTGGGVSSIHPNGVSMTTATRARFVFFSDTTVQVRNQRVLPYGKLLQVRGITCSTGPEYGVNCAGGGHHFTISTDDYWMG
ncbi:hypothetical protein [Gordonia sp. (in: high G+C Gram-positive bacteria)]|uniref:hypothetical protein n=1 Tax=Gordonia sp. (in: high G+C Gram-positive bacteria) TaxID=84139 RepID=UPI001DE6C55D|nr:hypothetical protein [Gordonia sp. (in: high G+C Gram-positive bacteria)]MCB1294438.1 hypothetical protein [Gordonia sp. (in: high G+C Gram-positive bacteria)]HMS77499.1 hypothetical protein [Gordonia sp. (in: high G+C Gram-positive bacteria)]HQV20947.1 hypothetical protein [Gordonia sp. (in: high G+C Gram-positive bacteria)]